MPNTQAPNTISSIFQDKMLMSKILVGLVVIVALLLFANSINSPRKRAISSESSKEPKHEYAVSPELTPQTATLFLKQVLGLAFDYVPQSAVQSHDEAFKWMTPEAHRTFAAAFWNSQLRNQIGSGNLKVTYLPTSIQAEAINPDGGVDINVLGNMTSQMNGSQSTQKLRTAFLVQRIDQNFRIVGVYNQILAN